VEGKGTIKLQVSKGEGTIKLQVRKGEGTIKRERKEKGKSGFS
jgi:hypothetical protein